MAIDINVTSEVTQTAVIRLGDAEAAALKDILQNVPKTEESTIHDEVAEKLFNKLKQEGF